jgi:hypothetical protein
MQPGRPRAADSERSGLRYYHAAIAEVSVPDRLLSLELVEPRTAGGL